MNTKSGAGYMGVNLRLIRIRNQDLERLRSTCRTIYKKHNPSMLDSTLSDSFMLNQLIHFYTTNDEDED